MEPDNNPNGFPMHTPSRINHNPPQQIFGAYKTDGSPVMPNLDAVSSQMFGDTGTLLDDSNEAKRRRIARACDMCRKKKIKCDGKLPTCSHCTNYKTECIFTQVEKKRNPPKGAKYIEGLENRLGRMENLLRLSGLLNEEDGSSTDLGTLEKRLAGKESARREASFSDSMPTSPSQATTLRGTPCADADSLSPNSQPTPATSQAPEKASERRSGEKAGEKAPEEVEALSDMMCSLVTNNQGETRYIGSSSGLSIFSPKGIQWVNEKTGDNSFQKMISEAAVDDNKWVYWKPEVFGDIFERRIFTPLPPKQETISLLKDYFENFNCMSPLFHQPTFMHLVDRQYSHNPYEGSGWWASLNIALAIAHRLRVMSNLVPPEEDDKAWGYLKNAMAVFAELTMRNTDLLSVQALLGMAMFMQGTPNPQPSYLLVAAAIRLSHSIGLHKRGSGFNLNSVEIEQRKRVFWIAYMLDKDICLRSGRPPAQDDDDMNVELPSADPEDNIGNIPLADGKGKVNLFRLMCEFSTIESKVYKQLYSTKASKQSDGELLNAIGELDRELEEWKDSIPLDFRPEHEIKASHTPLILHVVVLHFAYYNCLTTIHRMSVHHGYWTSRLSNFAIQGLNSKPLNPRVFSSAALCVQAARASIHLIKYVPQGDFSCVWLIIYFPVSALMTLFSNILQNPQDPRARSDVRMMNLVVTFLSMLATDEENASVKRMLGVCAEFERVARVVLDKADKDTTTRRKRKSDEEHLPNFNASRPRPPPAKSTSDSPAFSGGLGNGFVSSRVEQQDFDPTVNTSGVNTSGVNASGVNTPGVSSPPPNNIGWMADAPGFNDISGEFSMDAMAGMTPFGDMSRYMTTSVYTPIHPNTFPQPFVPPDLWQLPMAEWDWADMAGGGYPGFENGMLPGMDGNMAGSGQQQHHQHQQQQQQQQSHHHRQ